MTLNVVCENDRVEQIVRWLLEGAIEPDVRFWVGDATAKATTIATSTVGARREPTLLTMDAYSDDASFVQERRDDIAELLRPVGRDWELVLFEPTIEAVFFEAGDALERVFGVHTDEARSARVFGEYDPRKALERLVIAGRDLGELLSRASVQSRNDVLRRSRQAAALLAAARRLGSAREGRVAAVP